MEHCNDFDTNQKTKYIKFKPNASTGESGESEEQGENEEATGGPAEEEQIFLETTV
jgi:hypothetical protein